MEHSECSCVEATNPTTTPCSGHYANSLINTYATTNYEHRHCGGRRYHGVAQNPYPLPDDDSEKARLDKLHYCVRKRLGANILAPISQSPAHIVDVGTGSGKWVLEVSNEIPSAQVCGIDLSPIRPRKCFPNAEFRVMDLTHGLRFPSSRTDLVHSRLVHGGLTESQWPSYMKEILRILKPGVGWAQCIEMSPPFAYSDNGKLPATSALGQCFHWMYQLYCDEKRLFMRGDKLEPLMREAGFVDVQVQVVKIEIGEWGQDSRWHKVARVARDVWGEGLVAYAETFRRYYSSDAAHADFVRKVRQDMLNPEYHMAVSMHVVIGRKPEVPTGL